MEAKGIADVVPSKASFPINVRVIRRYIPYSPKQKPRDWYYLLTDKKGDAIEALIDINRNSIDTLFEVGKCYTIDNYFPEFARTYEQVVGHPSCLIFGKKTIMTPTQGNDIPRYHYEFAPYEVIEDRKGKSTVLTDCLCRVEKVSGIIKRGGKNMIKVMTLHESEHLIELTIWEKMAFEYDGKIPVGKVIAIASALVTEYDGNVQLESTSATVITIDPPIPQLPETYGRFRNMRGKRQMYQGYQGAQPISVAEIMTKNPKDAINTRFYCKARISDVEEHRGWYIQKCPVCLGRLLMKEGILMCRDEDPIDSPKYMYCVNAFLSDETGTVPVVLFDEGMSDIMGVECHQLVVQEGFADPKRAPEPMLLRLSDTYTFRVRIRSDGDPVIIGAYKLPRQLPAAATPQKALTIQPATPAAKTQKKHAQESQDEVQEQAKKAKEKIQ